MPYRFSRGSRRRSTMPRTVVQSFKKVLHFAGASRSAAATISFIASTGTDSVAAGQTGQTDAAVPTGSVIKYIEIDFAVSNLVLVLAVQNIAIQRIHSGQSVINPVTVGGNAQRNQVFLQGMFILGTEQNNNRKYRFKIPKKYQRVREGDSWVFTTNCDVVTGSACQIIYKFYR